VQHREHDLDRGPLLGLHDVDRDAATVVDDADAAVAEQRDLDRVAVARERLVDGVVDDLVDQVVQATFAGGADVHARAFADRLEPFEDRDRTRVVSRTVGCRFVRRRRGWDRGRGGRRLVGHGSMGS
jgi:hypothetical protein